MDYAMPRADDLPTFAVETVKGTPCTHNPLGVKGCGEAGAIGSPPAVINAICHALGVARRRDAGDAAHGVDGDAGALHELTRPHVIPAQAGTQFRSELPCRPSSFHQPRSVADAVTAFGAGGEIEFLAGGQSLLPSMRLGLASPETLVDLDRVDELKGITRDGDRITIGAMTRHAEIAASADVKSLVPGLAHLAEMIGDRQVRNRGTIGGSLANNDPAACYPRRGARARRDDHDRPADDRARRTSSRASTRPRSRPTSCSCRSRSRSPRSRRTTSSASRRRTSRWSACSSRRRRGGARVAITGAGPVVFRMQALERRSMRAGRRRAATASRCRPTASTATCTRRPNTGRT